MSDAALTIEQCRKLIHELATNDDFRRRYEDKPAAALVELGIPFHVVVNLKASCLSSKKLAKKEVFEAADRKLKDESAQLFASFKVPAVWIQSSKD
jgi:putative modified peptide